MVMTTTSKPEKQRRSDQAVRRLLAKHLDSLSSETKVSDLISISKQLLEAFVELSMATRRLIESWRDSQPAPAQRSEFQHSDAKDSGFQSHAAPFSVWRRLRSRSTAAAALRAVNSV
jgi:hypothetical protein